MADNENDYQGIDLTDFDKAEEDNSVITGDDSKNSTSDKKGSSRVADHKGSKKKLMIFFVSFVAIIGILFLIINGHQKSKSIQNTTPNTKTVQKNKATKPKEIMADNSKSEDTKNQLTKKWREATIQYSKDNNSNNYTKTIKDLDNQRQDANYQINDSSSNTAKVLSDAFSKMHDGLTSATNAKDANQAIEIFNKWAQKDKDYNEQYFENFKKDLDQHHIKYNLKKSNKGIEINY